jgi:hypothetical protein
MSSWETLEQDALAYSAFGQDLCKFGKYLASLGTSRQYVEDALDNSKISNKALYRALVSRGMECGNTSLDRHRRKECTCFKEIT